MNRSIYGFAVSAKAALLLLVFVLGAAASTFASPQVTISHVLPNIGSNQIPVLITIVGSDLPATFSATLSRPGQGPVPVVVDLLDEQAVSSTTLQAVVPAGITPAEYTLSLLDEQGNVLATLDAAYTAVSPDNSDDLFANSYDFAVQPIGNLQVGKPVSLSLKVHRLGGQTPLRQVDVSFYVGENLTDPVTQGNLLGTDTLPLIQPNGTAVASFTSPPNQAGTFQLYAVIDPADSVAELTNDNNIVSRTVTIRPAGSDIITPPTPGFTINDGSRFTRDRVVRFDLNFDTTDPANSLPRSVIFVEYIFLQSAGSWVPVQHSGWLPVPVASNGFPWELYDHPGAHYIQAWVADHLGNITPKPALNFINLVPDVIDILTDEGHLYRLPLAAGAQVQVRLTPLAGDPDLYVWAPDSTLVGTSQLVGQVDQVTFTATQSGMHQIEVDGATAGQYKLEVVFLNNNRAPETPLPFRPKGRFQPYFAPTGEPDDSADVPTAPTHFLSLPVMKRS